MPPPDTADVPPYWLLFSSTTTDRPRSAARQAVSMPPAPEPTTTTSNSAGCLRAVLWLMIGSLERCAAQMKKSVLARPIITPPRFWPKRSRLLA